MDNMFDSEREDGAFREDDAVVVLQVNVTLRITGIQQLVNIDPDTLVRAVVCRADYHYPLGVSPSLRLADLEHELQRAKYNILNSQVQAQ